MSRLWFTLLVIALAIGFSAIDKPASASFIAYESTRNTGNQEWSGALGMDFDVIAPIRILELGAYSRPDQTSDGGTIFPILVGIFDRTSRLLVATSASITDDDSLDGFNRYEDIADFVLGAGSYSIVAQGYGYGNRNGNTGFGGTGPTMDTGGGLISFVGNARYSYTPSFDFPEIIDGGPVNRYDAGTFKFEAVPEPSTLLLLGSGLLGLVGYGRKRMKK